MDFASSNKILDISLLKSYVRHLKRKVRAKTPDALVRLIKLKGLMTDKEKLTRRATSEFYEFLYSNSTMDFSISLPPKVSVVLILFNKAELTYLCLKSLLACNTTSTPLEVIVIDNCSTDLTKVLMGRTQGVKYIANKDNVGFLQGCNQSIPHISAPYLLLLNNDTEVDCNSIKIALDRIDKNPKVGAVGARITLPSNKLQEAGSIIYSNGTTKGYLRGANPDYSEAMFPRFVDYCSGAFLLTRSDLFKSLNGFDTRYMPAYYEETDYCVEIQKKGYSILYEPRVHIRHFEFGSATLSSKAIEMMNTNRGKFLEKHGDYLKNKQEQGTADIVCRTTTAKRRILYIDDSVPFPDLGAGFPRSCKIINKLSEMDNEVTLFPTIFPEGSWHKIYEALSPDIEVVKDAGAFGLVDLIRNRANYYDAIWVSRPHNMQFFIDRALKYVDRNKTKIIYDAEALFSSRVKEECRVRNQKSSNADRLFDKEMNLARTADAVVSVSEAEASVFRENGQTNTFVIGHDYLWQPGMSTFEERTGMVILCSLHAENSPNFDALIWFLDRVLPKIKERLGGDIPIHVAGNVPLIYTPKFKWLQERIHFTGRFDSLDTLLDQYRIGILPTRIAAGIPLKAYDLASRGLPAVCTKIIASQMNWQHQKHSLVADWTDPDLFARECIDLYTNKTIWNSLRKGIEDQQTLAMKSQSLDRQLGFILALKENSKAPNGSTVHD